MYPSKPHRVPMVGTFDHPGTRDREENIKRRGKSTHEVRGEIEAESRKVWRRGDGEGITDEVRGTGPDPRKLCGSRRNISVNCCVVKMRATSVLSTTCFESWDLATCHEGKGAPVRIWRNHDSGKWNKLELNFMNCVFFCVYEVEFK